MKKQPYYNITKVRKPLVYLVWLDHARYGNGWREYKRENKGELLICHSVGFIIDETKDAYILADSFGQDAVPWNGMHVIAKALVLKKHILKGVKL